MLLQVIHPNEPLYSSYNTLTSVTKPTLLKGSEPVIIDYVTVDGTTTKNYMQKVSLKLMCTCMHIHVHGEIASTHCPTSQMTKIPLLSTYASGNHGAFSHLTGRTVC